MTAIDELVALVPPPAELAGHVEDLDYDRDARKDWPEDYPYPLFPEPGGLLVWGGSS